MSQSENNVIRLQQMEYVGPTLVATNLIGSGCHPVCTLMQGPPAMLAAPVLDDCAVEISLTETTAALLIPAIHQWLNDRRAYRLNLTLDIPEGDTK